MTTHQIHTINSSSATRLTPSGTHSGMDITIQNVDEAAYVYIGGEGVTTSSYGYRLAPNSAVAWELPGKDAIYAISDTDGSQIAVIQTNLETGA